MHRLQQPISEPTHLLQNSLSYIDLIFHFGIYEDDLKNGKTNNHYLQLQHAISQVLVVISRGDNECHSRLAQKRSNYSAVSKTYCSILKWFYNGEKWPIVLPLLINNKLESDFKIRANHLHGLSVTTCAPLVSSRTVPDWP